ncbi:hypothetical protein NliqN6_2367 [Naganishia liquefaciens]|uniref:Uncharacterized protein n=1 Tax=Naganishia liquefaciens TaxID=104408 RepID=A0A8H3TSR1_9TREE|nr:hypothetical protein NliqN6_2367 [Naganishia liquefaciens]
MSAYSQPQAFSPTHSSLHFPLTSPPLHIPPSLESLEHPSSSGFMFARRGRTRHSDASSSTLVDSRRGSTSSMESLALSRRISQSGHEYKLNQSLQRQPSIRGRYPSNPTLMRRSPSSFALALEAHQLPQLSRTNSASTTGSVSSSQILTPPYATHDSFQVVSEEEEDLEDVVFLEPFPKKSTSPARPRVSTAPAPLKRPGLTRRDTPIPSLDLSQLITKPSKSFTSTLETQTPTPVTVPVTQSRPERPSIKRRDTPHPMFDPQVQSVVAHKMPNFISSSMRQSLAITTHAPARLPQSPVLSPVLSPSPVSFTSYPHSPTEFLGGMSPESMADDDFWLDSEEPVIGSPIPVRKFSSVLDGKVWVSV